MYVLRVLLASGAAPSHPVEQIGMHHAHLDFQPNQRSHGPGYGHACSARRRYSRGQSTGSGRWRRPSWPILQTCRPRYRLAHRRPFVCQEPKEICDREGRRKQAGRRALTRATAATLSLSPLSRASHCIADLPFALNGRPRPSDGDVPPQLLRRATQHKLKWPSSPAPRCPPPPPAFYVAYRPAPGRAQQTARRLAAEGAN